MEIFEMAVRYAILPLLSVLCTVAWSMYKKHDVRLDNLEKKQSETEKAVIEIKTDIKYISRDVKEIKDLVQKLSVH